MQLRLQCQQAGRPDPTHCGAIIKDFRFRIDENSSAARPGPEQRLDTRNQTKIMAALEEKEDGSMRTEYSKPHKLLEATFSLDSLDSRWLEMHSEITNIHGRLENMVDRTPNHDDLRRMININISIFEGAIKLMESSQFDGDFLRSPNTVRAVMATFPPITVRSRYDLLLPSVATFLLKRKAFIVPFITALHAFSVSLLFLFLFDVFELSVWLCIFVYTICSGPSAIFIWSCMNKRDLKKLFTSFQAVYFCANSIVLCCSFALLWSSDSMSKGMILILTLPHFTAGAFVDASLSKGRIQLSQCYFLFYVVVVLLFVSAIVLDFSGLQDMEVSIYVNSSKWHLTLTSIATCAATNLLQFCVKYTIMSIVKPGSLVVLKSRVVCVKLDSAIFKVVQAAHHAVFSNSNVGTINQQLHLADLAIDSDRRSSTQLHAQVRSNNCAEGLLKSFNDLEVKITGVDGAGDCELLTSAARELETTSLDERDRDDYRSRVAHVHAIREHSAKLSVVCIKVVSLCIAMATSAFKLSGDPDIKAKDNLVRIHTAHLPPVEIPTRVQYVPYNRFRVEVMLGVLWVVGIFFFCQVILDVVDSWRFIAMSSFLCSPAILFYVAGFNRSVLRMLAFSFETIFVWMNTAVMCISYGIIWQSFPKKIAGTLVCALPALLAASCFDANLQAGKKVSSRIFFSLNVLATLFLCMSLVLGLSDFNDLNIHVVKWTFSVSSIATSAALNLVQFGLKNLLMSFWQPASFVVVKSAVATLQRDEALFKVLNVANSCLRSQFERRRHGTAQPGKHWHGKNQIRPVVSSLV